MKLFVFYLLWLTNSGLSTCDPVPLKTNKKNMVYTMCLHWSRWVRASLILFLASPDEGRWRKDRGELLSFLAAQSLK